MQLKVQWITPNQIAILRGRTVVAAPKVEYYKDRSRFLETRGNHKTKNVFGMVNVVSNGCFRACTKFEKSETSCYNACYANQSVYALKNKNKGFHICTNGINNEFFHFYLPMGDNPNYKLNTLKMWRIGSESSDMSLALASGVAEPWIESNPDKIFTGISSDYFFVSAKKLKKLASYDNLVIGHTVSVWFSDDDLANRITQIERYQSYGVPTVVWITTNPEWIENKQDNLRQKNLIKSVMKLVGKKQIIEIPFHNRRQYNEPILNINPLGSCCDTADKKCKGCKILCGVSYLNTIKKELAASGG